jgi:hypothetical protein
LNGEAKASNIKITGEAEAAAIQARAKAFGTLTFQKHEKGRQQKRPLRRWRRRYRRGNLTPIRPVPFCAQEQKWNKK